MKRFWHIKGSYKQEKRNWRANTDFNVIAEDIESAVSKSKSAFEDKEDFRIHSVVHGGKVDIE